MSTDAMKMLPHFFQAPIKPSRSKAAAKPLPSQVCVYFFVARVCVRVRVHVHVLVRVRVRVRVRVYGGVRPCKCECSCSV